jgi:hypothetical protein
MAMAIIVIGSVLLVFSTTLVGTSMDTERRRARWRQVAEQRRLVAEERRALLPEHIDDPHADHPGPPLHPSRAAA